MTWLLKQRRAARFTVPDLEKRDDCTELRIPRAARRAACRARGRDAALDRARDEDVLLFDAGPRRPRRERRARAHLRRGQEAAVPGAGPDRGRDERSVPRAGAGRRARRTPPRRLARPPRARARSLALALALARPRPRRPRPRGRTEAGRPAGRPAVREREAPRPFARSRAQARRRARRRARPLAPARRPLAEPGFAEKNLAAAAETG